MQILECLEQSDKSRKSRHFSVLQLLGNDNTMQHHVKSLGSAHSAMIKLRSLFLRTEQLRLVN